MSDSMRPEAAPHQPYQLTESQQEAATRLMEVVRDQLNEIEKAARTEKKAARKNRLLFWTGEPGVGKTSTYLTAHSWFNGTDDEKKWLTKEKWKCLESAIDSPLSNSLNRLKAVMTDLKSTRVRWLHSLELELLAGQPNFLAAVLARIDDDLGTTENGGSSWSQPGDSERRQAEKELGQLQNDIALSWEGNLRERGPNLEPDVYASEVMRAERARLNVNFRFREVVGKLANQATGCSKKEPALFILPIDDFYLKPEVTLELLRFLRMISSPNLLILMLGDIDVVEDLLFWRYVGEASQLIGQGASGTLLDESHSGHLRGRAMSMATAALHKLIPKNQQVRIDTMLPEETLRFPRQRISTHADPDLAEKSVCDLLEKTGLHFLTKAKENDFVESPFLYLKDALQLTPRQVADFHKQLKRLVDTYDTDGNGVPFAHEKGANFSKITREKDEAIWATCELVALQVERALYSNAVATDRTDADTIWGAMMDPSYLHRWRFPEGVFQEELGGAETRIKRFRLQFRKPPKEGSDKAGTPARLSPLAQAWLAVLHDLLVKMNPAENLKLTEGNKPFYEFLEETSSKEAS